MRKKNQSAKKMPGSSPVYVVLSIAFMLFMVGVLGILFINAHLLGRYLQEQLPVELFLKKEASDQEINKFVHSIRSLSYVKTLDYIDKKQAVETAKKELNIDDEDLFETHIFPASIKVTLASDYVQPSKFPLIIKVLKNNTIVDEVRYPKKNLEKVYYNIKSWSFWVTGLTFLFLISSMVLINNTVRLNLYSIRFSIKTMQLVGAKKGFIYKPFLIKSLWMGFSGALLATTFLAVTAYYLWSYLDLPYQQDRRLLIALPVFLTAIGMFISFLSTYFSVRKFLSLKMHQLYHS